MIEPTGISPILIFDNPIWTNTSILIGQIMLILLITWIVLVIIMIICIRITINKKNVYPTALLKIINIFKEKTVNFGCKVAGVDPKHLINLMIRINNEKNTKDFANVPVEKRVIFFPQCLRSVKCTSKISSVSGIDCIGCGQCVLGKIIPILKNAGYKVYVIPGSTFITRIIKQYKPDAMIGVGCQMEVKSGLELGERLSIITLGIVTKTDGCIETTLDINELLKIASIGLPKPITLD